MGVRIMLTGKHGQTLSDALRNEHEIASTIPELKKRKWLTECGAEVEERG